MIEGLLVTSPSVQQSQDLLIIDSSHSPLEGLLGLSFYPDFCSHDSKERERKSTSD